MFDWHLYFTLQNLCLIDYHITFFAAGSYAATCRTHNINVAPSPVQFVPKINCCGINFCWHTNPNIALKIKFDGYQKVGNFQAQHLYFPLHNLCLIDYHKSLAHKYGSICSNFHDIDWNICSHHWTPILSFFLCVPQQFVYKLNRLRFAMVTLQKFIS